MHFCLFPLPSILRNNCLYGVFGKLWKDRLLIISTRLSNGGISHSVGPFGRIAHT